MFAYFNNTMICYGYMVGILAEISHNMFRFSKRRLTVNNPAIVPYFFNMVVVFGKEILTGKMLSHPGHEPSPEQSFEFAAVKYHRQGSFSFQGW